MPSSQRQRHMHSSSMSSLSPIRFRFQLGRASHASEEASWSLWDDRQGSQARGGAGGTAAGWRPPGGRSARGQQGGAGGPSRQADRCVRLAAAGVPQRWVRARDLVQDRPREKLGPSPSPLNLPATTCVRGWPWPVAILPPCSPSFWCPPCALCASLSRGLAVTPVACPHHPLPAWLQTLWAARRQQAGSCKSCSACCWASQRRRSPSWGGEA